MSIENQYLMINQKYTSEKSSIKQVPAGFNIVDKYFGWKPNTLPLCYTLLIILFKTCLLEYQNVKLTKIRLF